MRSTILFSISILLFTIFAPVGFFYAIVTRPKKVAEYIYKCALTVDQSGNVVMKYFFNDVLKKKDGYEFGNEDETISSAVGRNVLLGKLTWVGKLLNSFLNLIEPNHSIKSIGS